MEFDSFCRRKRERERENMILKMWHFSLWKLLDFPARGGQKRGLFQDASFKREGQAPLPSAPSPVLSERKPCVSVSAHDTGSLLITVSPFSSFTIDTTSHVPRLISCIYLSVPSVCRECGAVKCLFMSSFDRHAPPVGVFLKKEHSRSWVMMVYVCERIYSGDPYSWLRETSITSVHSSSLEYTAHGETRRGIGNILGHSLL